MMDAVADVARTLELSRKDIRRLLDRCRVTSGKGFRLKDHDPADTAGRLLPKSQANALLARGVQRLTELQETLYAQNSRAMLCVLQAMDAAGKDSTIKHVMSGVNPQGVQVTSFKAPGSQELAHDFLWRTNHALPARGHIGIFNRSYYEEVLVVRVHPELLERQHLPKELVGRRIWDQRLEAIADFERYLTQQGIVVLKFFLNVSKQEQKRRFLERLQEQDKNWKFSANDLTERAFWNDYQHAYEDAILATATPHAPWFVVPADHKWFTRLIVVAAMIEALDAMNLKFPQMSEDEQAALHVARVKLESEND
jgi:PPK2 family polyphosphate:nucleotide phosphotransferase